IDLEKRGTAAGASPAFLRRLLSEALERIKGFRPRAVLDLASLRRAGLFAAGAAGAFVLAWALFSERMPTALARIFHPLADIPPASGVAYTVEPGTDEVLRDEEITFTAHITRGEPSALRLELYGTRGRRKSHDLRPDRQEPGVWRVSLDGATLGTGYEEGFSYRVYGGRTWSKKHTIRLIDRPVIAGVERAVYFPKYMRIPDRHPVPADAVEVTGPEGGEVEVVVQGRNASAGEIQWLVPSVR